MKLIRVRLASGDIRHLRGSDEHDFGMAKFERNAVPYAGTWLETTEGPSVRYDQIVEAVPVDLEYAPSTIDD